MNECDMSASQIRDDIVDGLQSPAREYWQGMCRGDRDDLIASVKRESLTIAECIEFVVEWADE
jgi:hypothetical protein